MLCCWFIDLLSGKNSDTGVHRLRYRSWGLGGFIARVAVTRSGCCLWCRVGAIYFIRSVAVLRRRRTTEEPTLKLLRPSWEDRRYSGRHSERAFTPSHVQGYFRPTIWYYRENAMQRQVEKMKAVFLRTHETSQRQHITLHPSAAVPEPHWSHAPAHLTKS